MSGFHYTVGGRRTETEGCGSLRDPSRLARRAARLVVESSDVEISAEDMDMFVNGELRDWRDASSLQRYERCKDELRFDVRADWFMRSLAMGSAEDQARAAHWALQHFGNEEALAAVIARYPESISFQSRLDHDTHPDRGGGRSRRVAAPAASPLPHGSLPLHTALSIGAPGLAQVLLPGSAHAGAAALPDGCGKLPLHIAAAHLTPGSDVAILEGWRSQRKAAERRRCMAIIDELARLHPEALTTHDSDECIPLHCAVLNAQAWRVAHFAALQPSAALAAGPGGSIAAHLCCSDGTRREGSLREVLLALLRHGADPLAQLDARDLEGATPLHRLCMREQVPLSILAEMLELGADANARDAAGRTPAELLREQLPALERGRRDLAELALAVLASSPPRTLGISRACMGSRPVALATRGSVEYGVAAAFPLLPLAGLLRAAGVCRSWRTWVLHTLHNLRRTSAPLVAARGLRPAGRYWQVLAFAGAPGADGAEAAMQKVDEQLKRCVRGKSFDQDTRAEHRGPACAEPLSAFASRLRRALSDCQCSPFDACEAAASLVLCFAVQREVLHANLMVRVVHQTREEEPDVWCGNTWENVALSLFDTGAAGGEAATEAKHVVSFCLCYYRDDEDGVIF